MNMNGDTELKAAQNLVDASRRAREEEMKRRMKEDAQELRCDVSALIIASGSTAVATVVVTAR